MTCLRSLKVVDKNIDSLFNGLPIQGQPKYKQMAEWLQKVQEYVF